MANRSMVIDYDKLDTIYLDMDGVLASFDVAWCRWFGYEFKESNDWTFYERYGLDAETFYAGLDKLPRQFWAMLPLEFDADRLFNWALRQGCEVKFLTHACTTESCEGKKEWIATHYPETEVICVTEALQKIELANENTLLIDDKVETVEAFIEAGGNGRVWGKPYNYYRKYILGHIYFNKELL